jgi:hypothetical protein
MLSQKDSTGKEPHAVVMSDIATKRSSLLRDTFGNAVFLYLKHTHNM